MTDVFPARGEGRGQIAGFVYSVGDTGRLVGPQSFRDELKRAGVTPSYGHASLFPIQGNLILLMANHEYGINATQVTEATLRARGEIHPAVRGLRRLGGPWDGVQIAASPEQIGIRDGRRIRGRYLMTSEDLVRGAVQDDAVVHVTFPVDIHALTAEDNKKAAYNNAGVKRSPLQHWPSALPTDRDRSAIVQKPFLDSALAAL